MAVERRVRGRTRTSRLQPLELAEKAIHLRDRVVMDDADTNGALVETQAPHDLQRVVVAVPDGDVALAELTGDVAR